MKPTFKIIPFVNPSGATVYRVTGMLDGAQVRYNRKTEAEAIGLKQKLEAKAANIPEPQLQPTRLADWQITEAEQAYQIIKDRPLLDVLRAGLQVWSAPLLPRPLATSIKEFCDEKQAEGKRADTVRNLWGRLGWLSRQIPGKLVSQVSTDTLRALLHRKELSQRARQNNRLAWHNFFNWAKDRRYCTVNPVAEIKAFQVDDEEPAVLTLDECKALLSAARGYQNGKLVPYVALSLFAGLRPDKELGRLEWAAIDLDEKLIRMSGKAAKTRGRRNVEMSDNLAAILAPYSGMPIKPLNFRKDFDRVKRAAGFKGSQMTLKRGESQDALKDWTQDIMRHTAISMHLAKHQHEGKTAAWAGNSPDVIQRHYKGLVRPKDAELFWGITL